MHCKLTSGGRTGIGRPGYCLDTQ